METEVLRAACWPYWRGEFPRAIHNSILSCHSTVLLGSEYLLRCLVRLLSAPLCPVQLVYALKALLVGGMLGANSMMMGMMIKGMHQAGTTGHVTISSTVQTILTVSRSATGEVPLRDLLFCTGPAVTRRISRNYTTAMVGRGRGDDGRRRADSV